MKKIMFNEPFGLQQATFDGVKGMTRRVIPQCILDAVPQYQEEYYAGALEHIEIDQAILNMVGPEKMFQQYVYQVGEIVAIAQKYEQARPDMNEQQREELTYADMKHLFYRKKKLPGFKNKMFVKAEWMPHHIKITCNKVEPLCGISDEDCLREGIIDTGSGYTCYRQGVLPLFRTPYAAFKALIDKLNRRGFFETNPLVFAYSYEIID